MAKQKQMTNDKWVAHIMNYSPTGALSQMFVLQAIHEYAKAVARANIDELESPLVNPHAWKKTAEYILEEYKANYSW